MKRTVPAFKTRKVNSPMLPSPLAGSTLAAAAMTPSSASGFTAARVPFSTLPTEAPVHVSSVRS